jgi:DNA ligase-associated metallophosphoesterase
MKIEWHGENLHLLWQRAIYWQEQRALIFSDSHFGKGGHFRKEGIAIPGALFNTDLQKLDELLKAYSPTQLIVIGDMFHSRYNKEVAQFGEWRKMYPSVQIKLAKGNHDILANDVYQNMNIETSPVFKIGPFSFSHEPIESTDTYCFTGHIHPGVRLEGNARQSIRLACFHFEESHCTLPAFSRFTGLKIIEPQPGDKVYSIADREVILLK